MRQEAGRRFTTEEGKCCTAAIFFSSFSFFFVQKEKKIALKANLFFCESLSFVLFEGMQYSNGITVHKMTVY